LNRGVRERATVRRIIELTTHRREELVDITERIRAAVAEAGIRDGLVALYAQGATAALMIQENWDASVPSDVVDCLQRLVPPGIWLHDQQDNNGDAHIKAGLVGPSETVPLIDGHLGLSRWQGIFFCEFDGPRSRRQVVCTILADH
jgi:secondary thiamine-phosphate synthase enzyme